MSAARGGSVEFIVKPKEDLFLEGTLRKLPRVIKGEPYPCQMQKSQAFSCLFRHYAKHNGLRKEDLVFYFTDELQPDQTPESVHLMVQDEIWVDHRKPPEPAKEIEIDHQFYAESFRYLLDNPVHSDIKFVFPGDLSEELYAHKSILSARSEYFRAMFKKGGMSESSQNSVIVDTYEKSTFSKCLEYIYTNNVKNLESCPSSDIEYLLVMANEYCLDTLQTMCEKAASKMLNFENVSRFTILCTSYEVPILKQSCKSYLSNNMAQLRRDDKFRLQIEEFPQLGLFLFDAWPEDSHNTTSGVNPKKRRISEPSAADAIESNPVPASTTTGAQTIW